jgi:hypothetical protein
MRFDLLEGGDDFAQDFVGWRAAIQVFHAELQIGTKLMGLRRGHRPEAGGHQREGCQGKDALFSATRHDMSLLINYKNGIRDHQGHPRH